MQPVLAVFGASTESVNRAFRNVYLSMNELSRNIYDDLQNTNTGLMVITVLLAVVTILLVVLTVAHEYKFSCLRKRLTSLEEQVRQSQEREPQPQAT